MSIGHSESSISLSESWWNKMFDTLRFIMSNARVVRSALVVALFAVAGIASSCEYFCTTCYFSHENPIGGEVIYVDPIYGLCWGSGCTPFTC